MNEWLLRGDRVLPGPSAIAAAGGQTPMVPVGEIEPEVGLATSLEVFDFVVCIEKYFPVAVKTRV